MQRQSAGGGTTPLAGTTEKCGTGNVASKAASVFTSAKVTSSLVLPVMQSPGKGTSKKDGEDAHGPGPGPVEEANQARQRRLKFKKARRQQARP